MNTFSLLFPMEKLFEEFIARFICRYHDDFSLKGSMVHVQAKHMKKWLLRSENGAGKFRLKPDIVIDKLPQGRKLIIDTKWKRLKSNIEDSKNGVSQADIYQLYAYANRYDSPDNVLLYPKVEGVTPNAYTHYDDKDKKIRIETVDLNYDLFRNRDKLSSDLHRMMYDAVN
jgi:5-methylcytosine-specific restriction enzyme subunit McrC